MYVSVPLSSIITAYRAKNPHRKAHHDHKDRVAALASRLTNWRLAYHQCTYDLTIRYFTYVYLDPRYPGKYRYVCPSGRTLVFEYRPFYIGKGKKLRHLAHLKSAQDLSKVDRKHNIIRKIWKEGLDPIIKKLDRKLDEAMAYAHETDLIAGIGRYGLDEGPLTNMTDGSEATVGYEFTEAARKKMRRSQRRRFDHETDEQKTARVEKAKATKLARPEVERLRREKITEYNQREDVRLSKSVLTMIQHELRTSKEKKAINRKRKAYWENLSDEQRAEHSRKTSEGNYRRYETESLEAKKRKSESLKQACLTDPTLVERRANSLRQNWTQRSPEAKALAIQRRLASTTPEQRSAAVRRAWETRRANKEK